jgi:hypothetical protein
MRPKRRRLRRPAIGLAGDRNRSKSRRAGREARRLRLTHSVLRHIRVASKQELKDRLLAAVDYFDGDPVVHTWTYKLDKAA